jgi:DNA polymerase I-like protein with 3'-5' exonuclease and polymerase domains
MRLQELAVGSDGRNRCLLSAFSSKTGRNQPSNTRFIFGPSTWLRSLIRPEPGRAVAYVDWSAQEYGIAAALSGDRAMQRDYQSGDPYLAFAKRAGAVPPDATKKTHSKERDLFKVCCGLGAMYGAGEASLAMRLGISPAHARELLHLHRQSYPDFWRWSDAVQDFAMLRGYLETVFGWRVHVGPGANPRSLRNFVMQANAAEMMRLACCLATERRIAVCCPVHDALLIEAPADDVEVVVTETQRAMAEASELVLPGFPLRTEARIVRHPDRYVDERGRRMWATVQRLLSEAAVTAPADLTDVYQTDPGTCNTLIHP